MIPELQDPKVRRALALASDRNYVTDMVTKRLSFPRYLPSQRLPTGRQGLL